jgi:hypothetical protein
MREVTVGGKRARRGHGGGYRQSQNHIPFHARHVFVLRKVKERHAPVLISKIFGHAQIGISLSGTTPRQPVSKVWKKPRIVLCTQLDELSGLQQPSLSYNTYGQVKSTQTKCQIVNVISRILCQLIDYYMFIK